MKSFILKDNIHINQVVKNKNKSHRLKKFDTCPLSIMKKNGTNQVIYKSKIILNKAIKNYLSINRLNNNNLIKSYIKLNESLSYDTADF